MVNVFIANLDWEITSEDLNQTFSSFGKVTYAHVVYDNATKKSKGFGYVEMEDTESAINAINALNGIEINGRKLDVKIASPKGNRQTKEKKDFKSGAKKSFKPGGQGGNGGFQKKRPFNGNREGGSNRSGNFENRDRQSYPRRDDKKD